MDSAALTINWRFCWWGVAKGFFWFWPLRFQLLPFLLFTNCFFIFVRCTFFVGRVRGSACLRFDFFHTFFTCDFLVLRFIFCFCAFFASFWLFFLKAYLAFNVVRRTVRMKLNFTLTHRSTIRIFFLVCSALIYSFVCLFVFSSLFVYLCLLFVSYDIQQGFITENCIHVHMHVGIPICMYENS